MSYNLDLNLEIATRLDFEDIYTLASTSYKNTFLLISNVWNYKLILLNPKLPQLGYDSCALYYLFENLNYGALCKFAIKHRMLKMLFKYAELTKTNILDTDYADLIVYSYKHGFNDIAYFLSTMNVSKPRYENISSSIIFKYNLLEVLDPKMVRETYGVYILDAASNNDPTTLLYLLSNAAGPLEMCDPFGVDKLNIDFCIFDMLLSYGVNIGMFCTCSIPNGTNDIVQIKFLLNHCTYVDYFFMEGLVRSKVDSKILMDNITAVNPNVWNDNDNKRTLFSHGTIELVSYVNMNINYELIKESLNNDDINVFCFTLGKYIDTDTDISTKKIKKLCKKAFKLYNSEAVRLLLPYLKEDIALVFTWATKYDSSIASSLLEQVPLESLYTGLSYTLINDNYTMTNLCIRYGAKPDIKTLYNICSNCKNDISVRFLLEKGIIPDTQCLHLALKNSNVTITIIKLLVDNKAIITKDFIVDVINSMLSIKKYNNQKLRSASKILTYIINDNISKLSEDSLIDLLVPHNTSICVIVLYLFIKKGLVINSTSSILAKAIKAYNCTLVKFLLTKRAHPNLLNNKALIAAIDIPHEITGIRARTDKLPEMRITLAEYFVDLLIKNGIVVSEIALFRALYVKNKAVINILWSVYIPRSNIRAFIEARDTSNSKTMLNCMIVSLFRGDNDSVMFFLYNGADIHYNNDILIILAISYKHLWLVELLLTNYNYSEAQLNNILDWSLFSPTVSLELLLALVPYSKEIIKSTIKKLQFSNRTDVIQILER